MSRTPNEINYIESDYYGRVKYPESMDFWFRESRRGNVPSWIVVGFQQMNRWNDPFLNKDTFFRPSLSGVQRIMEIWNYQMLVFFKKLHWWLIVLRVLVKLKKILELLQKLLSFNHKNLIRTLDHPTKVKDGLRFVIFDMFSVYDFKRTHSCSANIRRVWKVE